MHYALFLPDISGSSPEHLRQIGLGALLRSGSPDFSEGVGPHKRRGIFATWGWGSNFKFHATNQVWKVLAANLDAGRTADQAYIGWEIDAPPTPNDLAHRDQFAGSSTRLRDGFNWLIPEAWKLPPHFDKDSESGEWIQKPAPEYAEFCKRAESFAYELAEMCESLEQAKQRMPGIKHHREMSIADTFDFASAALGINYRVTSEVVAALGLIQRPEAVRIVTLAIGFDEFISEVSQKKTFDADRYIDDSEIIAACVEPEC